MLQGNLHKSKITNTDLFTWFQQAFCALHSHATVPKLPKTGRVYKLTYWILWPSCEMILAFMGTKVKSPNAFDETMKKNINKIYYIPSLTLARTHQTEFDSNLLGEE